VALYRFLFAPVLLAVAVLTSSPRRAQPAAHVAPVRPPAVEAPAMAARTPASTQDSRVAPSHPGTVR
jgi:hypothetical protein